MKLQELLEDRDESGYYVLNGRPGEWEYVAGPFATREKAEEARRKNSPTSEDYAIRKLKKKPSL